MPKKINLQRNIPALMCRSVYEMQIISWVASRQHLNKNFKVPAAVKDFLRYYNIPPSLWDEHTALTFVYNTFGEDREMIFENLINKIKLYEQQ
jgi:hypothetical protein